MKDQRENTIIGWGLAGAVLAWEFYFRKISFDVYDSGENHSTRTAAGLVNPVVFKRLTKSWNADTLLPAATNFYKRVEEILQIQLLSHKNIYRVFASVEEENNWSVKQGDERFKHYLKTPEKNELPSETVVDYPFGVGKVLTIGNLNTGLFLDASKEFFLVEGMNFVNSRFVYATVEKERRYFFCEGVGILKNPYFSYLPMKPTHGDTLIIKSKTFKFDDILNKNMFVMALGNDHFKVGATYNWELTDPVLTEEGRRELEEKLKTFTNFDYTVVGQQAGIRPTVSDRRPLLGKHTENENVILFNGLGTKGVLIAPYYAAQLLDFTFNEGKLDPEVNIARFDKK